MTQKIAMARHHRMVRVFARLGRDLTVALTEVIEDAERTREMMQAYFERNEVEPERQEPRQVTSLEKELSKLWLRLLEEDERREEFEEEETIRVRDLPIAGHCAVCDKPVRVWVHESIIWEHRAERFVAHVECFPRMQEET